MNFASDNSGPIHPVILDALRAANDGHAPAYGEDALTKAVTARIRELFEAPQAEVFLVASGTAANALLLASHTGPWQTVFCSPVAHIHQDECNAPEFFTGGAKLTLVGADHGLMIPECLAQAIAADETRGVHGPQRGPVSLTQATENGTLYDLDQIHALAAITRAQGLTLHMDGARFANAIATLGCSPAEMTWKAGVDMVSFGGTKNGLMGVEAAILFDPDRAWEFELRRKRGGHLLCKHRYLAAQMLAYLQDDLWLDMARAANGACKRLADGLARVADIVPLHPRQANILFASLPRATHRRLLSQGAAYHLWDGTLDGGPETEAVTARFVTDWSASEDDIDRFLSLF